MNRWLKACLQMILHIPALMVGLLFTLVGAWLAGLSIFFVAWAVFDANIFGAALLGAFVGYLYFQVAADIGPPLERLIERWMVPDAALSEDQLRERKAQRSRAKDSST